MKVNGDLDHHVFLQWMLMLTSPLTTITKKEKLLNNSTSLFLYLYQPIN